MGAAGFRLGGVVVWRLAPRRSSPCFSWRRRLGGRRSSRQFAGVTALAGAGVTSACGAACVGVICAAVSVRALACLRASAYTR